MFGSFPVGTRNYWFLLKICQREFFSLNLLGGSSSSRGTNMIQAAWSFISYRSFADKIDTRETGRWLWRNLTTWLIGLNFCFARLRTPVAPRCYSHGCSSPGWPKRPALFVAKALRWTFLHAAASLAGEISSDLYHDQFFRRFLNLSFLVFIYMFLIHFKIVFDEKIHCQAQQKRFSILSSILHGSCPDMIIEVFSELYE